MVSCDSLARSLHSLPMVLAIYQFLLGCWIFESWQICRKWEWEWDFAQMTKSVVVDEKTLFGVLSTHLSGFTGSERFHLYSFQEPSLWWLCWFGNSPYWIDIICNYPRITESLPFGEKIKFWPLVIPYREVARVWLWF